MVTSPKYEGPDRRSSGGNTSSKTLLSEDRVRLLIQQSVADALQQQQDRILAAMDERFADLRIKSEAISKTVTGSVWVFLAFVAVAVWEHVKNEARKG